MPPAAINAENGFAWIFSPILDSAASGSLAILENLSPADEIDYVLFDPKTDAGKAALKQMIDVCKKIGLPSVFTNRIKTALNYYRERNHFYKVPQKIHK